MKHLIILLFIFTSCASIRSQQKDKKPNILLIVIDDLGYADFDPYSIHEASTPNMDRLAKAGKIYTQAYTTAPVCSPSRAGIITGKNQFRWDKPAGWGPGLPDSVKTIAEYLKGAGYATARIGKNDLGRNFHKNNVREYPLNHGYDEFLGFSAHAHDFWLSSESIKKRTPDPNGTSATLGPLMHNMGEKNYNEGYLTDIFTDEAISYLSQKRDKPFFLTLAYNAVHHLIHEVPQKYLDKYGVKAIPNYDPDNNETFGNHPSGSYSAYYDKYSRMGDIGDEDMRKYYLANINCLDDNIGRLLDALNKDGLDKETLIIFISDNGGEPLTGADNAPLTAGKYSLWEGGIKNRMAVVWPGKIEGGTIESKYVSAADILPTAAEAAGIKLNDPTMDGISLFAPNKDRLLVWKWQNTWAVRLGEWKLTNTNEDHWKSRPSAQYIKPILNDFSIKLFNVSNDPGERINLAEKYPEKVKELSLAYDNWCKVNLGKY